MDDVRAVMDAAGRRVRRSSAPASACRRACSFAATYPERTSALVLVRGYARFLWAPDYPWGWTSDGNGTGSRLGTQLLYFGSRRDVAEALGRGHLANEGRDLGTCGERPASPGTIETLATDRSLRSTPGDVLQAVRVPTLLVHRHEDPTFPIGGARYMAGRHPGSEAHLEAARRTQFPYRPSARRGQISSCSGVWEAGGLGGAGAGPGARDHPLHRHRRFDLARLLYSATVPGTSSWSVTTRLVPPQLVRFRGKEVNTAGDGFFASFDGPARAIRCARASSSRAVSSASRSARPAHRRMRARRRQGRRHRRAHWRPRSLKRTSQGKCSSPAP